MVREAMNFAQKMTNERSQEMARGRGEQPEAGAQPRGGNLSGLFLDLS